jgi:sterol desaturase/sphingolipid hydroxylase (fatty acid hydroxylase superfamily)
MPILVDLLHTLKTVFPAIVTLEAGRYVIAAGLVSIIVWAFWRAGLGARKIQTRTATAKDYRRELIASLRTSFIFACTGLGMYIAAKAGWLTIYPDLTERGPAYFAFSLVAMVLAHDAYFYWTHRAMHHPRLFRAFHRTHHKSHTPTPWTAYAFDVPEALVMVAFVPLWAVFVPMHDLAIYAFMTWQIARNVVGHAGVELSPVSGRPSRLFGWLNTTTHHDLHHQNARYNYGLYFTWWDRWMGTEYPDYQACVAAIAERARAERKLASAAAKVAALLLLGLAVGATAGAAKAQTHSDIVGNWATRGFGSIVQFRPCAGAPETMCGRIVWLWKPNDDEGQPRRDRRNPDHALRSRSLIGIEIVRGMRKNEPGIWSGGSLYNPDDGRTYTGDIRLRRGVLELRGCALGLFCDTQIWRRPEGVLAAVRKLVP